jgi:hypothetical protein
MHDIIRWAAVSGLLIALLTADPARAAYLEVLATDPPSGTDLPVGEALHVHIRYQGDEPLRFRVRGLLGGRAQDAPARSNPAPAYPAGTGEAIAWIEYTQPVLIDAVEVEISNHGWKLLDTVRVPLDVEWHSAAARPRRPEWVATLNAEQQQMTSQALAAAQEGGDWIVPALIFAGWSIPGYFILQTWLWLRWTGGWRRLALVPLWGTIPITAYTVFALAMGSNLWPLVMLFTVPWAFLYLLGLLVFKRLRGR